ncbi:hypothetical protein GCM10018980_51540 [Streptomyces capoamus]|uniref:Uncharacterized protein n=1 Tax=Streptomyces capoamus TaxID=68183 RepID=A0A919EZ97_9ACTN|nr:hypothetical protein [Streptomyces capoamus]GGW15791.1 hypothetical protein GCM10010501_29270 [Streptomyces libani subsp. rufus]GHG61975.1 hypothetical protein GCM10018980_51540 [Streptomyces capoamus]
MAHRPYPDVDRALAQLARGRRPEPPSEFQVRLAGQAQAAVQAADRVLEPMARSLRAAAPPVDEYRVSTR